MKLLIKNKSQQALQKLLDESDKAGGVPDKFLLNKKEFGRLLVELNKTGWKQKNPAFDFFFTKGERSELMVKVYNQEFTDESVNQLINDWADDKFEVTYNNVPIRYSSSPSTA